MVLGSLTQYRSSAADLLKQSLSPDAAISCSMLFDKQGGRDQSRPSWHCEALPSRSWNLSGKLTFFLNYFPFSAGLELLKEFGNVDCSYNMSPEELCAKVLLCDALIVRSGTKVNRTVFESSAGRLRVVGRAGVGIDNVGIDNVDLVVNAPTANTVAAAEHGIALIAAMARNVARQ